MGNDKICCPLVDGDIGIDDCIENIDVVDSLIKETALPDKYKTKNKWREVCSNCKWHNYFWNGGKWERQLEMDKDSYDTLQEFVREVYPQIKVSLVEADGMLFNMGFSDRVPCIVKIEVTEEQVNEILDITMWYEINAFNNECDYNYKNDHDYMLYEKYGWIWDFFYNNFCEEGK